MNSPHDPWNHRHFQKDKLRVKERYWHEYAPTNQNIDTCKFLVIPDGRTWRRYLTLFQRLIESEAEKSSLFQLVLLESAAEQMDWRSLSPCIPREDPVARESTAPRERTKILKIIEQQQTPLVRIFCDLSVREEECDEWDFLDYSRMSVAERSHHALARAGRLMQPDHASVILVVDDDEDRNNLQSQKDNDLIVVDMAGLLEHFRQQKLLLGEVKLDKLLELQARCDQEYEVLNRISPEDSDSKTKEKQDYLSEEEVTMGIQQGEFVRGRLEVTKANPREGFVTVGEKQYFVNQREDHFNRAFNGDTVVLKILPESHWGRPVGRRRLVFNADDDDAGELKADRDTPPVPSGRVVAIASQSSRSMYVATLVDAPLSDEGHVLLVPMDMRIPKIRMATKAWRKFTNQRLLVQVDGWEIGSNYPHGRCIEILGKIGELEVEIKSLLIEHEIVLDPFSSAAISSLPPMGDQWTVPNEEIATRRDLRKSRRIFSVDPPGCQDIDDAMHAEGKACHFYPLHP